MRQRVAFLRTLIAGKPVLALDEPFASLDAITRAEMQEWLAAALRTDPRTVVLVTHDVEEALYLCDRVVVLSSRPARIVAELSAPAPRAADRDAAVTDPQFIAAREEALRALRGRLRNEALAAAAGADRPLLLGLWQVACSTGALADALNLESFLVPSPAEIASSLWENRGLLAENAWVTLREMLLGILAALIGRRRLRGPHAPLAGPQDAAYPLIVASQTIPIVVISPILVVWFGYGITPKVVIVALICFFPITVNALDGLRSVDPEAVKMMRSLDASRWQRFWRVEAPAALPSLFTGVKIAVVGRPDRRGLRRVVGFELWPRPPDPVRYRQLPDRAAVRDGGRPLRPGAGADRPDRPRGATRRLLAIELRR